MRELRFVTLTEDGSRLLVEATDGAEQFELPVDAGLRAALAEPPRPVAAAGQDSEPADPPIGPREIQVRVRAGESAEELAAATGMALDRVMRFAAPVLDERRRIADEARRARARRTGAEGGDGRHVVFGEAVDERFHAHGIEPGSVRWDARRRDDGEWLITAEWVGGEDTHDAQWLFSRTSRSVLPLDDAAADLLSDKPIRPVTPPVRPPVAAAPPLAPGVVAFPPMPEAHTAPVPVVEDVFDQEAANEPEPLVPAAAAFQFDEPPLPLDITDPAQRPRAARREESDEERAARARIPSWDDILLGIKRRD